MAQLYTIFIVKGISIWNWLSDLFIYSTNKISHTYQFISNYMKGYNNIWLFLSGHTIPLSMMHCPPSIKYEWKYNLSTNQLIHHVNQTNTVYSLSWLSARIVVNYGEKEFNIDPFLETFRIYTNNHGLPTLETIFMAWCTYYKQWFSSFIPIQFHIIDDTGDEYVLSLTSITNTTINNRKLYITLRPTPLLSNSMEVYPHYKIDTAQSKEITKKLRVDNIENVGSTGFK
jgi:hypothetical protein